MTRKVRWKMIRSSLRLRACALFGLLTVLTAPISLGQAVTGTISGTVKDSSGAALPGTKIVILNQDTGISRTVEADTAGHYSASSLSLGDNRVTATRDRFQTLVRSGVELPA